MNGCSVHILFPQWRMLWEHLATSSPRSCSSSSAKIWHLKEVLKSAQHSRYPCLSAGLTCTCLESFRTCICSRKLRVCPLLQALLSTRFCRCTPKWSAFPSNGVLKLLLSPRQLPWPTSVVLQGHFSRRSLHAAQRRSNAEPEGWRSHRLMGTEALAQTRLWIEPQESLLNVITVFSDIQTNKQ